MTGLYASAVGLFFSGWCSLIVFAEVEVRARRGAPQVGSLVKKTMHLFRCMRHFVAYGITGGRS